MQFKLLFGLLAGVALIGNAAQAAKIELIVDYPYPDMFNTVHEEIAKRFTEKFPDYTVKFRAPTPEYEAAAQQALRHAVTRQLADVSYQGLNRQRVFVDRNIAVDLTPFIQAEKDWDKSGYSPALMSLGQVNGKQVGTGRYLAELPSRHGRAPESQLLTIHSLVPVSNSRSAPPI
ncbi:hypothetical protein [Achromobacter ruhlandii]|uniref:hypothetical protein n=1 Tax=Achromobacter ruhlandii TaxID=72557 RepID=UPI00234A9766|nr:hypothetical protein [Achromobacter ruhlandii]MDC6089397.1 hypothetical protein [Achromobacter ruhlandii]WIW03458.1 hypothetical protein PPH40_002185 [Achromobacter ruhlandii]